MGLTMFTRAIRKNKGLMLVLLILFILLVLYSVLRVPVVRVNELKNKVINGESVDRGNYERTGYYNLNPILSGPKLGWSFKISNFLTRNFLFPSYSHIAYKNYVFLINSHGILHALNANSGEEIWKIEEDEEEEFTCSEPWLIADDVLFYTVKGSFLPADVLEMQIRHGDLIAIALAGIQKKESLVGPLSEFASKGLWAGMVAVSLGQIGSDDSFRALAELLKPQDGASAAQGRGQILRSLQWECPTQSMVDFLETLCKDEQYKESWPAFRRVIDSINARLRPRDPARKPQDFLPRR